MIRWPNIGLFGQFEPCEQGILAALNENMFLLDTLVQMSILDFVSTLPDNPTPGDRYILESDSYAYDSGPNSIMVYDGDQWISIDPRPGYIAHVDNEGKFFWYNGTDWVWLPTTIGDVSGPATSLNNAIARFDGLTGKWITDSGVILDDNDIMSGVYTIYSDHVVTDVLKVKSLDVSVGLNSTDVGEDQDLSFPTHLVTKFVGALKSIKSISAPPSHLFGRVHILINETGDPMTIKDTASIRTGTGSNLILENGAAVWTLYDPYSDQWLIVGGSGSMGEFPTVSGIDERDAIPLEQRAWGKLFYDLQQLKYWYMPGGANLEDNDYWQALGKPAEWSYTFTGPGYGVSFGNDPIHYIRVDTDGGPQSVDLQNGKPQQIVFLKGTSDTDYPVLSKSDFSWTHLPADIEIKKDVLVQLYWDQDMSRWVPVGGVGSGSGALNMNHEQINLVPNPRGAAASTAGWEAVTYSAASKPSGTPSAGTTYLSISSEQGSLSANGSTKLKISKGTGNAQGEAVEIVMPVPEGYQASVLSLNILYKTDSADFTAGSLTDYSSLIFYSAQSNDGENFTMLEPSSFRLLSKGIPDTLRGYVQVGPNTTHLKLIAYVSRTETGAWDVEFEASVSKASYAYGTIGTEFTPVTMTLTNAGNATIVGFEKRVDDVAYYMARINIGTTLPTGTMLINLPSGRTINADKINVNQVVGDAWGVKGTFQEGSVIRGSSTSSVYITSQGGASGWNATTPAVWEAGDFITVNFSVPIQGWSAGAQLANGYDGRKILAYLGGSTTTIVNSATVTPFQFSTIFTDTAGKASTGTANAYEIPVSDFYTVRGGYTINGTNKTTVGWITLKVLKNGSAYGPPLDYVLTPGDWYCANGGVTLWFNAGEIVGLGADTSNGNANTQTLDGFLQIEKSSGSAFMSPTANVVADYYGTTTIVPTGLGSAELVFNTKREDTHGIYTAGEMIIPETGFYVPLSQIRIENQTSQFANSINILSLLVNGVNVQESVKQVISTAAAHYTMQVGGRPMRLKAGDKIRVYFHSNMKDTASAWLQNSQNTFFSLYKV